MIPRPVLAAALALFTLNLAPSPAMAADEPLASVTLAAGTAAKLTVSSPAFASGGDIPFENTQYRGNVFPGLAWTHGPRAVKSYAVILQDPDAHYRGAPFLHWTMFNIPPGVTRLERGMTAPPAGASAGPNFRGPGQPYMGPRTPPGPKHHYHFQVFALDAVLPPGAGADLPSLVAAMRGHVLAQGELVGLAQADLTALKRPATP